MKFTPFRTILKDGQSILLREVTPADRHLLEIGYAQLSSRSRYFRFLAARHDLTPSELDKFTARNGDDHVAIGALTQGTFIPRPIGIARYVRFPDQPHMAEIAITILDAVQRQGLGSLLLKALSTHAACCGISEFYALVHRDNVGMLGLLERFGGSVSTPDEEEIEISLPVSNRSLQLTQSAGDATASAETRHDLKSRLKTSGFVGADQSISVWLDDGGAIV
ncbi:GNAT family N-acetyltransferase [Sulfitobacter guttiformis]|uniref:RimJ/RimL family protein N-acetyltransferase n=1 Tax=Sulfitobacter guttiformis TaxID=74349 RepID=A0A420DJA3_9RHOB|nr:GNAT family N-acetyltransferase [Sulfitobacter guttiformis]KIN71899.1 Acetyltransferase [Sulfitobacter guttiformis KCTC 32187]RKE94292.1 RimJ/RimL family protein N-acetyltransferase [Sulfitobacter guttiformis]